MASIGITENKLLTVVVPVYNTSHYLMKCIDSIILQQYRELDIILIDDGSTDGSEKICDRLKNTDDRIRVFHQDNKGLVASRKLGVELAKGNLITFVDSDDWIEPDMYFQMMAAYMEFEPDMVASGITLENGNKISYEMDTIPEGLYVHKAINEQIIPYMMYNELNEKRSITPSVCNKIYKVDLLRMIIRDLDERITYGEDAAVTYIYIAKASKIMILNNSWYHYVIHSNSMSRKYHINSFEKIYQFYTYMTKQFLELGIWDQMEQQLKKYTKLFLAQTVQRIFDITPENPIYLFPFEMVEKDSRVVIYGAGKVGSSYRNNLLRSDYAELVGCIDRNYDLLNINGLNVSSPDMLKNFETDYIVIGIEKKEIALEIESHLLELGVKKHKIIWKQPVRLF